MTDRFYSVVLGDSTPDEVTEGGATSGEAIELRLEYDATGLTKERVLLGLKLIEHYITRDTYPPA